MKTILIILFSGCLLCTSCIFDFDSYSDPEADTTDNGCLDIYNYSDSAIYVYMACGVVDSLPASPGLELFIKPKTEMLDKKGNVIFRPIISPEYRINAFSIGNLAVVGSYHDPKLSCEEKVLTLFFIKDWIMRNYSWAQIYAGQLYESKETYTEEVLISKCWLISYISPKLRDKNGQIIIPFYGYYNDEYNN